MASVLLISSPNGGGLFLLRGPVLHLIDRFDTTGLCVFGHQVLRGLQPDRLCGYGVATPTLERDGGELGLSDIHDVLVDGDSIYAVGTAGNEIVKLDRDFQELTRWVLPGESDSWHVNSLAKWRGRIVFSAFGEFSKHQEYKGRTHQAGFVQDLLTEDRLIRGLSQPHSLTPLPNGNILLANSETMELFEFDSDLRRMRSKQFDRYVRGLCLDGDVLYVGLSRSRNIGDVDYTTGAILVALDAETWEERWQRPLPTAEIYDIQALPEQHLFNTTLEILLNSAQKTEERLSSSCAQIEELQRGAQQDQQQIRALADTVQKQEAAISGLGRTLQLQTERFDHLEGQSHRQYQHLYELVRSLSDSHKAMELERNTLLAEVVEIKNALLAIHSSHSWQFTAPLRALRRKLDEVGAVIRRVHSAFRLARFRITQRRRTEKRP